MKRWKSTNGPNSSLDLGMHGIRFAQRRLLGLCGIPTLRIDDKVVDTHFRDWLVFQNQQSCRERHPQSL